MSRPPAESPVESAQFIVDASVLAHGGLTWEREFSGIRFERLIDMAVSISPPGHIALQFGLLDKRPVLHGELTAVIELVCQRCMGTMQYQAHEPFELMLIESAAELPIVPETHEPWIANAARLNVFELIEEQLLLALPLIAKHTHQRECRTMEAAADEQDKVDLQESDVEANSTQEVQRPFGNLRALLNKN